MVHRRCALRQNTRTELARFSHYLWEQFHQRFLNVGIQVVFKVGARAYVGRSIFLFRLFLLYLGDERCHGTFYL